MVTTFELPGCHDMWTVISSEVKEEKKVPNLRCISSPLFLAAPFPNLRRCRFHHQAEKSSESEEGADTGEEGEEGEKEKEEKQKDVEEKAESSPEEDPKRHGFLILSREESTMVKKKKIDRHPVFNV